MSVWGNAAGLASVTKPPSNKSLLSPQSSLMKDECGGLIREPPQEGYCQEIVRKDPETLCGRVFFFRKSQKQVCKTYCELHRFCFLPLPGGGRCPNYRRSVDRQYCTKHEREEKDCGALVHEYKKQCGDNILQKRCVPGSPTSSYEEKEQLFANCFNSRSFHHQRCLVPEAQSFGHINFLHKMGSYRDECKKLRNPISRRVK